MEELKERLAQVIKLYNEVISSLAGRILIGDTVKIYDRDTLDKLCAILENADSHLGIVIGGCAPWHVSVMRK